MDIGKRQLGEGGGVGVRSWLDENSDIQFKQKNFKIK